MQMVDKTLVLGFALLFATAHAVEPSSTNFLVSKSIPAPAVEDSPPAASPLNKSIESLDMTSAAMEAAMTDLMLGKTVFGATPMGGSVTKISNILTKTMMPDVKNAHNNDQRELVRLAKDITKCGSTKVSAMRGANLHIGKYRSSSKQHKRCRADEAVKFTTQKNCLVAQNNLHLIKKAECGKFATLAEKIGTTKDNRAVVTKAGGESTESYMIRISATICGKHKHGKKGTKKATGGWGGGLAGGYLDKYWRAKEACTKATNKWTSKVKECRKKVADYKRKLGECTQFQVTMDGSSCKGAIVSKDVCESYAECYTRSVKTYRAFEGQVVKNEIDRKAEWRGLNRMACLIKSFADGKVTGREVDACRKKAVSTKPMNIKYPKVPRQQKCAVSQLYPATGAYKRTEFAPLPMLAKGQESVACSGMREISLKPRGNARGCKCTRVTLNGAYSAHAMVKCTNCLDVRKSTAFNSCPKGTKLFSPASKSDWQTVIASVGPLRAPHWIIDVSKPSGGCTGCRNHAMNSGNRFQRQQGWRTSDGSPWWLRSTKFNQPDGNYAANCVLMINPVAGNNVNKITFDDYGCNYHSKSYYCQLKRIDLKPSRGPKSCKCQLVDLTGSYKPGKLVKCQECTDVYRSNQKNSCPKGMKIFSPTSARDWSTFIKSAQPLQAPHFIIDVTRPQDGSQGKTAMNSKNARQATWRTSDRSPWWLRSTSYSEPSGGYKANCFMHLWNAPHNSENNIQFNDHHCDYHSRSYYCQPVMKKAPKVVKVDCQVSGWTRYDKCLKSGGFQTRKRHVVRKAKNGGKGCPTLTHRKRCPKAKLPKVVIKKPKPSKAIATNSYPLVGRGACRDARKSHRHLEYIPGQYSLKDCSNLCNKRSWCAAFTVPVTTTKGGKGWCEFMKAGDDKADGRTSFNCYAKAPANPWFCVARLNRQRVSGPFKTVQSAKNELNKQTGSAGNQQMICEMSKTGAKKDPHAVGGQNQGAGGGAGFNKWWGGWSQVHSMNAQCDKKSRCSKNKAVGAAPGLLGRGACRNAKRGLSRGALKFIGGQMSLTDCSAKCSAKSWCKSFTVPVKVTKGGRGWCEIMKPGHMKADGRQAYDCYSRR